MSRKIRERWILSLLLATAAALILTLAFSHAHQQRTRVNYADLQLQAASLLEDCFAQVRTYKEELGIPLSPEDYHHTGMIGDSYSGITTTLGAIEAKRTTANPEMGALCVRLLHEAGVQAGDKVGAGFSGSFPAMNLAVIAACQVMDVDLVYISSVGASTYGANNPQLTFPEIAHRLVNDGFLDTDSAAVTLGGDEDSGIGMDEVLLEEIVHRLTQAGLPIMVEKDFHRNLQLRREIYQSEGPISCFIAVGGNITSMGRGEAGINLGQGLLNPKHTVQLTSDSGLVQEYLSMGIPVINLLNIKKLMADYGLPYDPIQWSEPGSSAIYYQTTYPTWILIIGLIIAGIGLSLCAWIRWRAGRMQEIIYMRKDDIYGYPAKSTIENPDRRRR